MTVDKFKMWKVGALKDYLSRKGIKTTGKKDDLVARAFYAWENNLPDTKTAEEVRFILASEYQQCLHVEGVQLPDPLELKTNWQGEKVAMEKWHVICGIL